MIIVMQPRAQNEAIQKVIAYIRETGLTEHVSVGAERVIIGAVGDERLLNASFLEALPEVERAVRIVHDWRIISREAQQQDSVYVCRGVKLGEKSLHISLQHLEENIIDFIDPFYVPSNPYQADIPSLEQQVRALPHQVAATHQQQRPVIARVRDLRQLDTVLDAQVDVVYLGGEWLESRSMQVEVGRLNLPIVMCKDKHHTLEQWLVAAERVAMHGNHQIILGEAGTLNINQRHPYRLDVEAIAEAVKHTHLPVLANVTRLGHGVLSQAQLSSLAMVAGAKLVIQNA